MTHIDEHTIELYVLNAQEVTHRREEIDAHLRECHGCRNLAEEMSDFHKNLAQEIKLTPVPVEDENQALVRTSGSLKLYEDLYTIPASRFQRGPIERFRGFVRRHPVSVTTGTFGMAACLLLLLNSNLFKRSDPLTPPDLNPARYGYNPQANTLEIFNKEDSVLWHMKIHNAALEDEIEQLTFTKQTEVVDLDGDGMNEVLTTLKLIDFPEIKDVRHLRIFNAKRELIRDIHPEREVHYRDRPNEYSPYFGLGTTVVRDSREPGKKEIFVAGSSMGRSPSVLFRLNYEGGSLGEYWHFGHATAIYLKDINGDGENELIVAGVNDNADSTHNEFPSVAVLDPDKVVGETKSSACPGFLLKTTDAELYYLQFPRSDLDNLFHSHGAVTRISDQDDQTLMVHITSPWKTNSTFDFYYFLDQGMRCLFVKSNNPTDILHNLLVNQHKLTGTIDAAYLDKLKQGVRYWDGKEWRKEVVRVEHKEANR